MRPILIPTVGSFGIDGGVCDPDPNGLTVGDQLPKDAAAQIGTVEGLTTAPVLRKLSERVGVEMPITNAVCDILGGRSLDELIAGLMGRRPTAE